jgi:two-component sensor histidine kinase
MLYALSGVDRSAFDKFPMPRNTDVFAPTFRGEGVVRSDDITADPRYGRNSPRKGMPEGHLPVRSYLAVPVTSRSGEVLGGLFFGHSDVGVFTARAEELVRGVAGQAAVAIDNARLYAAAQQEIERRRRSEEQQQLLINELNHRVKNTLATVQSIVAQTSRSGRTAEEVREATEGRLLALSAAHDLLTRHYWEGADVCVVVERALAPFRGDGAGRIRLGGPRAALAPQQALAIAMALHELATNAVKYGALSVASGRVLVDWTVDDGRLRLNWAEQGGPPVSAPSGRGFGSRLLERGLARDLGGEVRIAFEPAGVRCEIRAPMAAPSSVAPLRLQPAL